MKKEYFFYLIFMLAGMSLSGQTITTVAGCGIGDDSLAAKAELSSPIELTFDYKGNAYIADQFHYRIRKIDSHGIITTFAGTGIEGYSGDGGPATQAQIGDIYGIATNSHGDVYISDFSDNVIRKIDTAGIISTIAGTDTPGYNGDNIPAITAQLQSPAYILCDRHDNIIFSDNLNGRVRKIDTSGLITTVAGNGSFYGLSSGPATAASLGLPFGIAIDKYDNLYIGTDYGPGIWKVDTVGLLHNIANSSGSYSVGTDGDGGLATAATMTYPFGLAIDTLDNLYFSDADNYRVRKINLTTNIISNYAGNNIPGYYGDGSLSTTAMMGQPWGLACDKGNNLYIADLENNCIRLVKNDDESISNFSGQNGIFDENYLANDAEICTSLNLATDASGNVYIADATNNRIRKLDASTGVLTTVAGDGIAGDNYSYSGDGGPATNAKIFEPSAVAFDATGDMFIADNGNNRVRMVNTSGVISTFAGNGIDGYSGDGNPASAAELHHPRGVTVDASGNVYIAEGPRVRKVNTSGIISTYAGTVSGFSGDGGPATLAKLYLAVDVAVDGIGNVYISDGNNNPYIYDGNNVIRKVDTSGIITSITSSSAPPGFSGDGYPSVYATINAPQGIKADTAGNVFFADMNNERIRLISKDGVISTIAGDGMAGFVGDGGIATDAELNFPAGVAFDKNGNLYIADDDNARIRKVDVGYLNIAKTQSASKNMIIYPNPTFDNLTVQLLNNYLTTAKRQLILYNTLGQEVYTAAIISEKQTFELSTLPPGIYIVYFSDDSGNKEISQLVKY